MEKRGVIDEHTPSERPDAVPVRCNPPTKEAADAQQDHLTARLAEAAAEAAKKPKS